MSEKRIGRRRFLWRALLATLGVGAAGAAYSTLIEPHWILVTRRRIRIPGLAGPLVGKTIAHLSDFHLGIAPADYVARCVEETNALEPDMVVLTGDFVGSNRREDAETVAEIVSRLSAPLGVYFVSGNHDFGVYRQGAKAERSHAIEALMRRGLRIMDGDVIPFDGEGRRTWLAGLGDLWAGHCHPDPTLAPIPPGDSVIVLSHNPDSIPMIVRRGADLVLSGHTHGGQVDIPLIGPPILPVRLRKYYSGLYQVSDRTRLYVSNGLGYLLRVRLNARPEIALHTLDYGPPARGPMNRGG